MKRTLSVLAALSLLLFAAGASADPRPSAVRVPVVKERMPQSISNPIHIDQGGDTIATATPILSLPYTDSGTTTGYVDDYCPPCGFTPTAPDVVYSYTPPADVFVDIDLCGSSYDTELFVLQDDASNCIGCNDDLCGLQSGLNVVLTTGHTYYIVVDAYYGAYSGPYTIHVAVHDVQVSCPPGSLPEGEPLCGDGYHDSFNGGCWSDPPMFSALDCSPTGVQTVCGTYGGFGLRDHDTDWYQIVIPPGPAQPVTWTVRGESSTFTAIIDGRRGCAHTSFYDYTFGAADTDITLSGALGSGTWWFYVSPLDYGPSAGPCGEDYVATLSGFRCQPVAVAPVTWGGIKSAYR